MCEQSINWHRGKVFTNRTRNAGSGTYPEHFDVCFYESSFTVITDPSPLIEKVSKTTSNTGLEETWRRPKKERKAPNYHKHYLTTHNECADLFLMGVCRSLPNFVLVDLWCSSLVCDVQWTFRWYLVDCVLNDSLHFERLEVDFQDRRRCNILNVSRSQSQKVDKKCFILRGSIWSHDTSYTTSMLSAVLKWNHNKLITV